MTRPYGTNAPPTGPRPEPPQSRTPEDAADALEAAAGWPGCKIPSELHAGANALRMMEPYEDRLAVAELRIDELKQMLAKRVDAHDRDGRALVAALKDAADWKWAYEGSKRMGNGLYGAIVERLEPYLPPGTRDLEWDVLPGTLGRIARDRDALMKACEAEETLRAMLVEPRVEPNDPRYTPYIGEWNGLHAPERRMSELHSAVGDIRRAAIAKARRQH